MSTDEPTIIPFVAKEKPGEDPVVISGIGIGASLGSSREEVWQNIQTGESGVRLTCADDPVGPLRIPAAMVDWLEPDSDCLKSIQLSRHVAAEAMHDADIDMRKLDPNRFACSISAQFGDIGYMYEPEATRLDHPSRPWHEQLFPSTASTLVANEFGLYGPRLCHTTACASGLVSTIAAARMIQDDQADFALCGAADAVTHLIISSFNRMGVLAHGPDVASACKPFDRNRSGFVMGEGAAMMILEKRSHAIERGATIYAEIAASQTLCQAHHVTGLDEADETLKHLIRQVNRKAGWEEVGPQYINAHGTGTQQNDRSELIGIRAALGPLADRCVVSSNKAVVGHLINAAGSLELALTALAMRDGFAPPTMHLDTPEQIGRLDCLPQNGSVQSLDRSMKLSLAFGGHLVGIALQSCPQQAWRRPALPLHHNAKVRQASALERATA